MGREENEFWARMQENKENIISFLRKRYSTFPKKINESYNSSMTSSSSFDYSLREEDFEDIVSDAMITTFENREKGKLKVELSRCELSKYLARVCINETQSTVCEIVRNLPEPCYTILWGFYWDNLSLKELADNNEKIKNAGSAKVIKHRCMEKFGKRLKEIGYER